MRGGTSERDQGETAMDVRAAVAFEKGKPLEVTTVTLDGPKAGEVLVEIKATGVCHTDEFTRSGADPEGLFPAILRHEGAGIVVDVGPGVTSVKKGNHVIPLYTPECRQSGRRSRPGRSSSSPDGCGAAAPSAARAGAPTCPRSSTGTCRARSRSIP